MQSVLVTTQTTPWRSLKKRTSEAFFIDRPFLLHVVEQLIAEEVRELKIVADVHDRELVRMLGDGARWGCKFEYSFISEENPFTVAFSDAIGACESETILLSDAATWLAPNLKQLQESELKTVVWTDNTEQKAWWEKSWNGWACIPRELLEATLENQSAAGLDAALLGLAQGQGTALATEHVFSMGSARELLEGQRAVLEKECRDIVLYGRDRSPTVRLCRNTRIHKTASVEGPVLLGDNVWIGKGVRIGANVSIGHNSVIDHGCYLENCSVEPNTFVCSDLDLINCYVTSSEIIDARNEESIPQAEFGFCSKL